MVKQHKWKQDIPKIKLAKGVGVEGQQQNRLYAKGKKMMRGV
jgi:hypothetical protein